MRGVQPGGNHKNTSEAEKAHQDAFPGAPNQDEEGVSMGAVLEELGLSNTLRPLPVESAPQNAKTSVALLRKHTSSKSTAASRRTTQSMQQDPRCCKHSCRLTYMTCMHETH